MKHMLAIGMTVALATLSALPVTAQTISPQSDGVTQSIQDAARHIGHVFVTAAGQLSEADYAFKPTPDVRSLGQILAHVAENNFWFCASALGEKDPGGDIEKTKTTKNEIQKALIDSFAYCDRAYAAMADTAKANASLQFMGKSRPALAVLNFRNYHSLLHWGNVITYMRLRGKVPPSTP